MSDTKNKTHTGPDVYATVPTGETVFLRTFLPWQLWKFIKINLKMLVVIRRSHRTHLPGAVKTSAAGGSR